MEGLEPGQSTLEIPPTITAALGTLSPEFASACLKQIAALSRAAEGAPSEEDLNAALAGISAVAPRDEIEAMLAVQMTAVHVVAIEMLVRAKRAGAGPALNELGNLAVKLLRTFTSQMEALNRYRRGGEQKVTVEHVHVHAGGQAIVGAVSHGAQNGGVPEKQEQSDAVLSQIEALEGAMQVPRSARITRLPDARGVRRRAEG